MRIASASVLNACTTTESVLAAALWASIVPGEGLPSSQTSQIARLSRQQAIQLAFAGLTTSDRLPQSLKWTLHGTSPISLVGEIVEVGPRCRSTQTCWPLLMTNRCRLR
jgi:hypothetical protein